MDQYRQGDILFVRVENGKIPQEKNPMGTNVVAYGETTGHAHVLEGNAQLFQIPMNWISQTTMLAEVGEGVRLVHDEHDTIEIPQGAYYVRRQRVLNGETERYVSD